MSELFINMISIIVHQDDILVLTSSSFDDHLRQLGNVFAWLHHNNLQVNAQKLSFCALDTKYLGFILTREGIKLLQQKVNAILQVPLPCNDKQVGSFVSMLNHYKAINTFCEALMEWANKSGWNLGGADIIMVNDGGNPCCSQKHHHQVRLTYHH